MGRPSGVGSLPWVVLGVAWLVAAGCDSHAPQRPTIAGYVSDDEQQPLPGARVRIKGQPTTHHADESGRLVIADPARRPLALTAALKDHYIGGLLLGTGDCDFEIRLKRLPNFDNVDYDWVDPTPDPEHDERCGNCHAEIYDEWRASGHAMSARNRRFLSLYDGTDWQGQADVGWSLRRGHPFGIGVCAACHAPAIAFEHGASDDMRDVVETAAHGVHCDFCHKVEDVVSDEFGLTHGRFGFQLLRPAEGQLFFGPLDDVDRGEDAYSPLQRQSQYCASCHEGIVFGVPVYTTFSEWLASPARRAGQQCQSCHMGPTGKMTNFAPGVGGIERDPRTLASHALLPGGRAAMLRECLQLDVDLIRQADLVICKVTLTARNVGHRVPTGYIDRHLIVVVEGLDDAGQHVPLTSGPTLPAAAGPGFAFLPGELLAKRLVDGHGNWPTPFWEHGDIAADSRLEPERPRATHYGFPAAARQIRTRVLYRRFWQPVAESKDWPDDTITVHDRHVKLN